MKNVYVVMGHVTYETSRVVAVYESEASAQKFKDRCVAHETRKPYSPGMGVPDAEWDKYVARCDRWERYHPAHCQNDSYSVEHWSVRK